MCGITGIYNRDVGDNIDRGLLECMAQTLAHRGPDDSGYYVKDNLGFGFKRLSIIDLSTGSQPMYNEDKTLVSVCNGEIYNYQELRQTLQEKGHRFYTKKGGNFLRLCYTGHLRGKSNFLSSTIIICHLSSIAKTPLRGVTTVAHCVSGG